MEIQFQQQQQHQPNKDIITRRLPTPEKQMTKTLKNVSKPSILFIRRKIASHHSRHKIGSSYTNFKLLHTFLQYIDRFIK